MQSFSDRFKEIPTHLVQQVNGDASEQGFRFIGKNVVDGIESHLSAVYSASNGATPLLKSCKNILDFGSGLGRVILPLMERAPQAQITGFDIDPLMNKWATYLFENSKVPFVTSTFGLNDRSYDLITVISVFTHLDSTSEFWLSELHRLLSDDGRALVTYQDENMFEDKKQSGILSSTAVLDGKYVHGSGSPEGGAAMGTFYTSECFRAILEQFFVVHRQISRGLFGQQSVAVVSRKEITLDRNPLRLTYAQSLERELFQAKADADKLHRNALDWHGQLEGMKQDLETFTHLLWTIDDERRALKAKLSSFQASLAWQLDKPLRKLRKQEKPGSSQVSVAISGHSSPTKFCYYFYDSPFRIYRESKMVLRGWCTELSGLEIAEMRVCINGERFGVSYGLPATDVLLPNGTVISQCSFGFAAAFTVPAAGRHSFELEVSAEGQPWTTLLKIPIWSTADESSPVD